MRAKNSDLLERRDVNKTITVSQGPELHRCSTQTIKLQTHQTTVCVLFNTREPAAILHPGPREWGGSPMALLCVQPNSCLAYWSESLMGGPFEPITTSNDHFFWIVNKQSSCLSAYRGP